MVFSESDLIDYVQSPSIPPEAMAQLNKLLFKELREYCDICEDDRMTCVLSPMCPKRVLLKVRIESGAALDDIPKFCYGQAVNNIRRYMAKNTTLYTPQDEIIYNKDFFDLMFPGLTKKIQKFYRADLPKLHKIIQDSRVPAVNLDIHNVDQEMFQKIIGKDKVIREGTFVYHIQGEYMIIWYENIFVTNFKNGTSIVNAKKDMIQDLNIVDLVFHIYAAEKDITGTTNIRSDQQMILSMKIPFSEIAPDYLQPESDFFSTFIAYLEQFFFEIEIASDAQENLIISLHYQNVSHFLKRNQLIPLSYQALHRISEKMDQIRRSASEPNNP
jgi:hypothetical protein